MVFDNIYDTSCDKIRCVYQLLDVSIHPSADLIYSIAVLRSQCFSPIWDCHYTAHRSKWSNKRGILIINTMSFFLTQRTDQKLYSSITFLLTTPQKAKSWIFHLQDGEVKTGDLFSTETLKDIFIKQKFSH